MPDSPVPVTDFLSNLNDQMVTAAGILGRSRHRQTIFEIVYYGSKQVKTVKEIMIESELSQTHVLKEGGKMAGLLFEKVPGGYRKKKEFATRYRTILAMARDKKKRERVPTKVAPRVGTRSGEIRLSFPSTAQKAKYITIDDIGSFSKVDARTQIDVSSLREKAVKNAFAKIIGERGSFKDWGGEKSDLYSTRVRFRHKRIPAAIAFKGRGTKGKLVPGKMGKNGDQINRLFEEPAQLFLVVYGGQIEASIISQMRAFAVGRAIGGDRVYYGVIDGADLGRLAAAYPAYF